MNPQGTSPGQRLGGILERVRSTRVVENRGRVVQLIGLVIESEGPLCAVGELCRIEGAHKKSFDT
jgi:flagellar biosynthesis/type III secretory pathway ATPase